MANRECKKNRKNRKGRRHKEGRKVLKRDKGLIFKVRSSTLYLGSLSSLPSLLSHSKVRISWLWREVWLPDITIVIILINFEDNPFSYRPHLLILYWLVMILSIKKGYPTIWMEVWLFDLTIFRILTIYIKYSVLLLVSDDEN